MLLKLILQNFHDVTFSISYRWCSSNLINQIKKLRAQKEKKHHQSLSNISNWLHHMASSIFIISHKKFNDRIHYPASTIEAWNYSKFKSNCNILSIEYAKVRGLWDHPFSRKPYWRYERSHRRRDQYEQNLNRAKARKARNSNFLSNK